MKDLTVSERVVVRMLEAAWSAYLSLPHERNDEAMEFRRKLDDAAAVVKLRPARRAAAATGSPEEFYRNLGNTI